MGSIHNAYSGGCNSNEKNGRRDKKNERLMERLKKKRCHKHAQFAATMPNRQ